MTKEEYLARDRQSRINNLYHKYVVVCDSKYYAGEKLYLQDQEVCNKGTWTGFFCNAKGFDNPYVAKAVCNKFKFGNPRVEKVTPDYKWKA